MKRFSGITLFAVVVFMLAITVLVTSCDVCIHRFQNGICVACGKNDPNHQAQPCTHNYVNGVCDKCGVTCRHNYENGACSKCGLACTHNYEDGVCSKCGFTCTHNYEDGVCTTCGFACAHDYEEGVCITCGVDCAHDYVNSVCTKCGITCLHTFTNGTCTTCSFVCKHTYQDGVCDTCGLVCTHTYKEGVCTVCEVKDPNYVPADGGRSLYGEIVDKYKYLILYKYVNEELPPRGSNEPFYMDALYEVVGHFDPSKTFGYSYKDINGDGYEELFLTENTSRLYALFTVKDKAPVLVTTFQNGMGYLQSNGTVFFNIKDGYKFLGNHITRLVDGKLVGIAYGWEDPDDDIANSNDIYYYIFENGTRIELAKADYNAVKNEYVYYWENATRLTKLSNLTFHPALLATATPEATADFSTYDAIINTFGQMHSMAVAGRWERSRWIGGAYDEGMIFENEADFIIYNKLFAAYFLVQKGSSFGYAKKDLNGDGVEELILLEGNFNVLAVFTQVEGEAVLLDSYNNLRTAFIDSNGRIHVRERIIPGSEEDCECFVYEVRDGALVATVAIGIKFDAAGNQKQIYQIADGATTAIEQIEWDARYADYETDLGNATFAEYTKQNSGLSFVAVSAT